MTKYARFWRTTLVLSPVLLLSIGSATTIVGVAKVLPATHSQKTAQATCAATTDAEIVTAIQARIKADKRFADQWKHINVSSIKGVVTLSGWAKGKVQVNDLVKFARTTKCVKRVVIKLANHLIVGCGAGQKACGDMCIDKNEQCNLMMQSPPE